MGPENDNEEIYQSSSHSPMKPDISSEYRNRKVLAPTVNPSLIKTGDTYETILQKRSGSLGLNVTVRYISSKISYSHLDNNLQMHFKQPQPFQKKCSFPFILLEAI